MEGNNEHVGRMIKRLSDALERRANNSLRELGVSVSQLRVLRDLHRSEGGTLSLKQLEASSGVAQSTMWGIVSRLEAKGLVKTSAGEEGTRRTRYVALTPRGQDVCLQAIAATKTTENRMLQGLSAHEVAQLKDLLARVGATLD